MNAPFRIRIAFAAIARPTFDVPFAQEKADAAWAVISGLDADVAGGPDLLMTQKDLAARSADLTAFAPDILVLFQASFADSGVALAMVEAAGVPAVLWSVPEARTGGRLRLNSLCGVNLAAHALRRAGLAYTHVKGDPEDAGVVAEMEAAARAAYAKRRLASACVGIVGRHPDGYETCNYDPEAVRRMCGTEIEQIEIADFIARAKDVDRSATDAPYAALQPLLPGLDEMDDESTRGTLKVYVALRELIREKGFDAVAVRCWPEFFNEMDCAACVAVAMLNDEHTVCSCEADAYGTLTNMMLSWLSGSPVFLADLVDVDSTEDTAVLWHCGAGPLSMADRDGEVRASVHPNRKRALINDFAMKPGRITLARLTQAGNETRLIFGGGEFLQRPNSFSGTSGVVRFDRPVDQVWEGVMSRGLEHHISFTYGDHVEALAKLAEMLAIPTAEL